MSEIVPQPEGVGPFGGHVRGICAIRPGEWILWTDDAGPFRRRPAEDAWERAGDGLPETSGRILVTAVASCFSRPETVAAALLDGWIFLSHDAGRSWQPAGRVPATGEAVRIVALHPADPARLIAATKSRVFLSDDGGGDWNELLRPSAVSGTNLSESWSVQIAGLLVDPLRPGVAIFVTRDQGTLRTFSWGQSILWFRDNLPGPVDAAALDPTIGTIAYVASGGDLYRTTDAGKTWEFIGWTGRGALGRVTGLIVDPGRPSRLFALASERVLKVSEDGGFTWRRAALPAGERPQAMAVHPLGAERGLLLGTATGVWESLDLGQSWTRASEGLADVTVLDLALEPDGSGTVWAATDRGLFRHDMLEGRWHWLTDLPRHTPAEDLMIAAGPPPQVWVLFADYLRRLERGVRTFPRFETYAQGDSLSGWAGHGRATGAAWWREAPRICGVSEESLWVASPGDEGGMRLRPIEARREGTIDPWLRTLPCGPEELLLGYGPVLESPDGGQTWNPMALPPEVEVVWDVAPILDDCSDLLLATDRGLFRVTRRAGNSWARVGPGAFSAEAVLSDPLIPGRWFLRAGGTVYMTVDGGATWSTLPLPWGKVTALAWEPASEALVAGLEDAGVRWIRLQPGPEDLNIEPIAVSPNPFRYQTRLSFVVPEDVPFVELRIYTVYGDRVRTIRREGPFAAGQLFEWQWDGLTDQDQMAVTGIYVFRSHVAGRLFGGKALFLR